MSEILFLSILNHGVCKGIGTDPDVCSTVMDRVLLPVLGYGCELWDLDSRMNKLLVYQAWRRGVGFVNYLISYVNSRKFF